MNSEEDQHRNALDAVYAAKFRRVVGYTVKLTAMLILIAVVMVALYAALRFVPNRAVTYDTMEDHFKYGSLGGDVVTGIPFWIWQAMPLVCAETLNKIAGDRLAPDFLQRVAAYTGGDDEPAKRRALSREGYKALGLLYEKDDNGDELGLPIGMSKRRSVGLDRTYINCSICHTSIVRAGEDDPGTLVLGMPANLFNLYDFEHFLLSCGKDGRQNEIPQLDFIPEIQALGADLGLVDRYLVYPIAIWALQDIMRFLENVAGFSAYQPEWGPGRNDTFTNNKVFLHGFNWRRDMENWNETGTIGSEDVGIVDWPSTWLQGARKRRADGRSMQLHWDGNNDQVEERNLNAALATSALPAAIDHESLECIEQWLETLEPPAYPFPIDQELAARGKPVYQKYCSECHGQDGRNFEGKYVGFVTHIDQVSTDRYRLDNYTEALALNMATTYAGKKRERRRHDCPGGATYEPPLNMPAATGAPAPSTEYDDPDARAAAMEAEEDTYRYKRYRKTYGYANSPLDGIWLRAPYLHNGSVPTLRDLLKPSADRPTQFYRGNPIYDPDNVGFASTEAQDRSGRKFFDFKTTAPGNGNWGHEGKQYGTELAADQKDALLEYLKTF